MNFPKYWMKGRADRAPVQMGAPSHPSHSGYTCWGWSDDSLEAAEALGQQRALALKHRLENNLKQEFYSYGDKPVREEVLEQWKNQDASLSMAITFNSYGCRVLNTASAMFVDIDHPEAEPLVSSLSESFSGFFNLKPKSSGTDHEHASLDTLENHLAKNPAHGTRVYRTKAGLRYLFTNQGFAPSSDEAQQLMSLLGADPLYQRLCKNQDSFRARLNPKPWRCGVPSIKVVYPYAPGEAERIQKWQKRYHPQAEVHATCQFLAHHGNPEINPEIQAVVDLHDKETKAHSALPLA